MKYLAVIPIALVLAGCESTSRFSGGMFGSSPPPRTAMVEPLAPEPAIPSPTTPVTSEALPPPGAGEPAPAASSGQPLPGQPGAPSPGPVASLPPAAAPAPAPAAPAAPPSSRAMAGNWKIADARGNCSIALTQQTLLDLYRASPAGCQGGSLGKVNAWQQRGQEIVLLEPGGRTAVRLFPKGDGTYEGAATTSGTIVRMSR